MFDTSSPTLAQHTAVHNFLPCGFLFSQDSAQTHSGAQFPPFPEDPSSQKIRPPAPVLSAAAGRNAPDLDESVMALTNFILTVAVVGAGALLFTTDIRRSGALFRRNARQLRQWLEEDTASAASK